MSTTSRGDAFGHAIYRLLEQQIETDRFWARGDCCRLFQKKGYHSKDRQADIVFDLSIEITSPGQESVLVTCAHRMQRLFDKRTCERSWGVLGQGAASGRCKCKRYCCLNSVISRRSASVRWEQRVRNCALLWRVRVQMGVEPIGILVGARQPKKLDRGSPSAYWRLLRQHLLWLRISRTWYRVAQSWCSPFESPTVPRAGHKSGPLCTRSGVSSKSRELLGNSAGDECNEARTVHGHEADIATA